MQKVVTVYTTTYQQTDDFVEKEFPTVNKYLDEGYTVKEVHPIIKPNNTSAQFAIVFVLDKFESSFS